MRLLKKGESGQALIMALILLAFGSFIVVPTLLLASTSLKYHQIVEKNTKEFYAADSGIQYAQSKLCNSPGPFGPEALPWQVNGKAVNVIAQNMGGGIYKITSKATTDSNSSTSITSYVRISTAFFDNAISSLDDIILKPGTEVVGDVQYNGTLSNKGTIYGDLITDEITNWPMADELSADYLADVHGLTPLPDGYTIDISSGTLQNPYHIGPLYAGGNLTISGKGVAQLYGTVYVAGSLSVSPDCQLILNEQTIYADGSINFQPQCTTSGTGCVIAKESINYQPNISGNDFVFLMSIEGNVTLKPGNSFYGSIAGSCTVELMPGTSLNWVEHGDGLNFPAGSGGMTVLTYTIEG